MAQPRPIERLTAQDLLMLWADDFGWSQDIGVLAILDGTRLLDRDGRVRIETIRRQLEPRLHLIPRFRQLLYRPRLGLGWPLWVDAASFDLADHVRVHPLAAPGDQAQLLAACAQLCRRRLESVPAAVGGVVDVVLAAVAGGLRLLLASRGEEVEQLALRVAVPVSLHQEQPGQASGNQDAMMLVPLPLGEPDPVRRLDLIAAETAARKQQARPQAGSGIFRFVAVQRAWYRFLAHQRSVNLFVTNVPGPPVPLYLAGAPLLELFPKVSILANVTLTVGVLSYAGQLNFTAVADQDTCPDLEVFAQGVRSALDDLARSMLVAAS